MITIALVVLAVVGGLVVGAILAWLDELLLGRCPACGQDAMERAPDGRGAWVCRGCGCVVTRGGGHG